MRTKNEELWVEWAKRVERWAESGLTAKEFAAELGVEPQALMNWKWKLRAEQKRAVGGSVEARPSKHDGAQFLRVVRTGDEPNARAKSNAVPAPIPTAATGPLEVVFANGVTLRITKDFDESTLLRVVGLLGGKT